MERAEKEESVATLKEVFKAANVVVVAHYSGLTVAQMQTLRRQMRQRAPGESREEPSRQIALEGSDVASLRRS